jgi:hypothetical protein
MQSGLESGGATFFDLLFVQARDGVFYAFICPSILNRVDANFPTIELQGSL